MCRPSACRVSWQAFGLSSVMQASGLPSVMMCLRPCHLSCRPPACRLSQSTMEGLRPATCRAGLRPAIFKKGPKFFSGAPRRSAPPLHNIKKGPSVCSAASITLTSAPIATFLNELKKKIPSRFDHVHIHLLLECETSCETQRRT